MLFGDVAGEVGRLVVLSAKASWLLRYSCLYRTSQRDVIG